MKEVMQANETRQRTEISQISLNYEQKLADLQKKVNSSQFTYS